MNIFDKNLQALRKKDNNLADRLLSMQVPEAYSVVFARTGKPVLRALGSTFHSMYDPVKEGYKFVEAQMLSAPVRPGEDLVVFGLGFGYHLKAMLETGMVGRIIEPRIEVVRLAMEHVDLEDILESMDLIVGSEKEIVIDATTILWSHQPSVKYNKTEFGELEKSLAAVQKRGRIGDGAVEKKLLKIMVITPIYGGSLPIATYCSRALKNMGHDVQLWDAAMFDIPFRKALGLNLDNGNKKMLHDLFLHLVSEMIVASCLDFNPDIVLALAQAPVSQQALARIRQSGITTAFWFVEDYQYMEYWRAYAPCYDFYFTIQEDGFFEELARIGVKHYKYLPLAADPEIHRPLRLNTEEQRTFGSDISFMGAGYYNREKMLQGLLDFDCKLWGTDWNPASPLWKCVQAKGERIETQETVKIYNATRVNINLHSSVCHEGVHPFGDFINPRTFEIAACGGFQLVDSRRCLDRHFSIDEEMVCYGSLEELREKISYYLRHPRKRDDIAQSARARTLQEHTYEHRMREMLKFIKLRKPECFYSQRQDMPVIKEPEEFCQRYPETTDLIHEAQNSGTHCSINNIVAAIMTRNGSLAYHEALFLLIHEFYEKSRGTQP